jgi:photosystem II stability/assembly factor-like uncharacterized protein
MDYSFVSDGEGWMLGSVPCASGNDCPGVVLHSVNGGASWASVGASPFPVQYPCARPCGNHPFAGAVRFADPLHGYLFADELAVTDDGGHSWRDSHLQVPLLAGDSTSVLAVVLNCPPGGSNCIPDLERAPVGGMFEPTQFPGFAYGNLGWFARQGTTAWLLLGGSRANVLLRTRDDGRSWKGLAVPCPASGGAQLLASTGTAVLWTVCGGNNPAGQRLLTSSDAGTTWTASPILPKPNPTQSVQAIAPTGPSSGYLQADDQQIWATTDNGQHWNVSYQSPPGADNFPYMLGVEDPAHAHFLSLHAVHFTSDGGHSWTAVTFP